MTWPNHLGYSSWMLITMHFSVLMFCPLILYGQSHCWPSAYLLTLSNELWTPSLRTSFPILSLSIFPLNSLGFASASLYRRFMFRCCMVYVISQIARWSTIQWVTIWLYGSHTSWHSRYSDGPEITFLHGICKYIILINGRCTKQVQCSSDFHNLITAFQYCHMYQ
jgi:hypothetical protein